MTSQGHPQSYAILRIYLDSDVSMCSQVARTVSNCFSILRRLRSIRRSLTRSVFQSIVVALVLSKLDFGNATLAGLPLYQLRRLQSVMNAAARLVFSASRYDQTMPLQYFTGCTGFMRHNEYLSSCRTTGHYQKKLSLLLQLQYFVRNVHVDD